MKLVEIIGADSQFNLARTLRQAAMIREIIKNDALRQSKPQLILASTFHEEHRTGLLAREPSDTSRHPEAIHNAKMGSGRPETADLCDEQVNCFENGRPAILRRHSAPPCVLSEAETRPRVLASTGKERAAPRGMLAAGLPLAGCAES
jgi:hypothetical protein